MSYCITKWIRLHLDNIHVTTKQINNMNYNVQIKYFADKVYIDTDIQTILHEISIFTDLSNIISITKVTI